MTIEEKVRELILKQDIAAGYDKNGHARQERVEKFTKDILALISPMSDDIDKLRIQLAGCGVAALGYVAEENDCKKGDYGWSPSFQDVKDLRDKYIKLLKIKPKLKEKL